MAKPFIGQLDRKVSVYRFQTVKDSLGDRSEVPVLVFETRASEQSNSGAQVATEKIQENTSAVYVMRKRNEADLFSVEKLQLWEEIGNAVRKFEITHVSRVGRTHLQLNCRLYE